MLCFGKNWIQGIQRNANYAELFFNLERLTLILLQIIKMHEIMTLL